MTHHEFALVVGEMENYTDCDAFVSDLALSSMWGEEADIAALADELGTIWDVVHMSFNELRARTGMTQTAFAERFCIPRRTVENWSGRTSCPLYTKLMMADLLGLLPQRS